jgi:hypothetical protein
MIRDIIRAITENIPEDHLMNYRNMTAGDVAEGLMFAVCLVVLIYAFCAIGWTP